MANKKNQTSSQQKYYPHIIITLAVLLVAVTSWALHERAGNRNPLPTNSKLAYVDGNDAVTQVSNFYSQYIHGAKTFQTRLVSIYGDQNLAFYDAYYQHGFDPITCSATPPTSVSVSLVSTGPVATVKALATYPDHSTASITAKVVLTNELKIDSITCPGSMSGLPPAKN